MPLPGLEAEGAEDEGEERLKREFWGVGLDGMVVKVRRGLVGNPFCDAFAAAAAGVNELVFLLYVENRALLPPPSLVLSDLREQTAWFGMRRSREDDLEAASIVKGKQEA